MGTVFKSHNAKIFISDLEIGLCTQISVEINTPLEPYYQVGDENVVPFELGNIGNIEISGTIKRAWVNTYYLKLLFGGERPTLPNNSEFDMRLQASLDSNAPILYLYKCRFKKGTINIPANGWIEESFDFIANSAGTGMTPPPVPPCPIGEQIENGGFETGDFTGWTNTGFVISDLITPPWEPYEGSYCIKTFDSGIELSQTFVSPISYGCWNGGSIFQLYIKGNTSFSPTYYDGVDIHILYDDASETLVDARVSDPYVWKLINLKSYVEVGKTVVGIRIVSVVPVSSVWWMHVL